ncbi:MAG: glycosyltransferase, partial [Bacteroidota bacterium]
DHAELGLLFPCIDIGVFPSIVREAGPLVVKEAVASGAIPVGMDHAGTSFSLDHAEQALPENFRSHLRIRLDPREAVMDIVQNVSALLDQPRDLSEDLHQFAETHYDWRSIAAAMATELQQLSTTMR